MSDRREPTAEITRQPWQTPTLVNLSTRRTESGSPSSVEDVIFTDAVTIYIGPTSVAAVS
ncbi:MAG: hypothetical protein JNL42_08565 [Anaerolineae bacterium]|nr:hypothetical protein [Anaerolineae bacterium]